MTHYHLLRSVRGMRHELVAIVKDLAMAWSWVALCPAGEHRRWTRVLDSESASR